MTLFLLIAAVMLALGVSAVCSLLEAALLSLTPGQVASLKRRHPAAGAIWQGFKADVEKPISVILICNTAAHTIGATVAGAEFEKYMEETYGSGGWSVLAFGGVFTLLMLQFTEILPKTLGVRYNKLVALIGARPMAFLVWAMRPILWATRLLNRPFEREPGPADSNRNLEEITTLAAMARYGKVITEQQERMIRTAGRLGQLQVRQIMTPRNNVQYLRVGDPFPELLKVLRNVPYTRLPVCGEGGLDDVRGIVHLKDVFNVLALVPGHMSVIPDPEEPETVMALPEGLPGGKLHVIGTGEIELEKIIRPVRFVPESQPLDRLLREFQSGHTHMAIVVDEYGGVEGLVTLEDVLEEIVGDIEDEFDEGEHLSPLEPAADGSWTCSGGIAVREVIQRLDIDPETLEPGGVVTLGGWITRELGRWPRQSDVIEFGDGWTLHVEQVEEGSLQRLRFVPRVDDGEAQ